MEKREIDLTVSCYGKVKDVKYDVVILPWGATEPHNLHLPYLTDCILPHDIAVDAAALALEHSGVRCMVMPPVPFGAHNPGQRELPFCIHTRYSTQQANLDEAGDGESKPFAIPSLNEKVGWAPRHWDKATIDSGVGNPRKASAEKGAHYVKPVIEKLAQLFTEVGQGELY